MLFVHWLETAYVGCIQAYDTSDPLPTPLLQWSWQASRTWGSTSSCLSPYLPYSTKASGTSLRATLDTSTISSRMATLLLNVRRPAYSHIDSIYLSVINLLSQQSVCCLFLLKVYVCCPNVDLSVGYQFCKITTVEPLYKDTPEWGHLP